MGKKESPKKESPKKVDAAALEKEKNVIAGRIYRLRILQSRLANQDTLGRYAKEEAELTQRLAKLEK